MQTAEHITYLNHYPFLAKVEKVINENLTHDWMLRIEYSNETGPYLTEWNQWGDTRFAVKEAAPVIRDILSCHARCVECSIRLCAERFKPRVKFIYPVFQPVHYERVENTTTVTTALAYEK